MSVVRSRRSRYRERSGSRRFAKFVIGVLAIVIAVFGANVLQHDLRVDRTLSHRGVTASGTLDGTGCYLCRAVGVSFTTASGQHVSTVVSAIGPQADTAMAIRYDPQHPGTVHPAHGVREEEIIAGALLLVGLFVLLRCLGLPRRRHRSRRGGRIRTRASSGGSASGHVRLLGS